ncbi:MAG: hypothetical protein AB7S77_18615 [Desulfatirhabdiaceae bacterium]
MDINELEKRVTNIEAWIKQFGKALQLTAEYTVSLGKNLSDLQKQVIQVNNLKILEETENKYPV